MDTRAASHFQLTRGIAPYFLMGRLLSDADALGHEVAIDPATGGEVRDDRPAFILSTEGEASDGHVVRQHWDLSRASSVGVPVLWSHDPGQLRGQWEDLKVMDLPGGRSLVGRARLSTTNAHAIELRDMIREGILRAVSVGWQPGATVRRGNLAKDDPLYRDAEDGDCGEAREGLVMGTAVDPNKLIECSLVSTPADPRAVVTARILASGDRAADALIRSGVLPTDPKTLASLLRAVAADPTARAYLGARAVQAVDPQIRALNERIATLEARLSAQTSTPSLTPAPAIDAGRRPLADILRS